MGRYRTVETEKDEKSYEARIWWTFWGISLIVLVYTAYHQIREYDLVHNGQCIEAEYYIYHGQELARYVDENGGYHSYNVDGRAAIHGENTILLYYKTDLSAAEPHIHPWIWIRSYILFGLLLVVSTLLLRKIYREDHTTNHGRETYT